MEKVAPHTGWTLNSGRTVAILYSTELLKRCKIKRVTEEKVNLYFRVKSVSLIQKLAGLGLQ